MSDGVAYIGPLTAAQRSALLALAAHGPTLTPVRSSSYAHGVNHRAATSLQSLGLVRFALTMTGEEVTITADGVATARAIVGAARRRSRRASS